MFKKILSSIGIGAAKVDLILEGSEAVMGQTVEGRIAVTGGKVEQQIGRMGVQLRVNSSYVVEEATKTIDVSVAEVKISDAFTILPGENKEYPFSFAIPEQIPVSSVTTRYYFLTNLDIEAALDPKDKDYIHIKPSGLLKNFLLAFENLGFVPRNEGYTGSYQIFDFYATRWLAGKLDELVFQFEPAHTQESISGFFEIDKKTSGLGGWLADEMDLDEKKGRFHFTRQQLATVETAEQTIRNFIEKYYGQIQV